MTQPGRARCAGHADAASPPAPQTRAWRRRTQTTVTATAIVVVGSILVGSCGGAEVDDRLSAFAPAEIEYLRTAQLAAGVVFEDETEGLYLGLVFWRECRSLLAVYRHLEARGSLPSSGEDVGVLRRSEIAGHYAALLDRAGAGDATDLVDYLFDNPGGCRDAPADPDRPSAGTIGSDGG